MQLDTEDGETFVPPAGVVASPTADDAPKSSLERPESQGSDGADLRAATDATRGVEE